MIQLEKYHGQKSRFTCPACGVKHSFVRYQDDFGKYIDETVGRCNRESSCGYHKKPRDFFAENPQFTKRKQSKIWFDNNYVRNNKNGSDSLNPPSFDASRNKQTVFTIEKKYLLQSLTRNTQENNFIYFLETLFDEETVKSLIDRFAIGTTKEGKTIFWQIDEKGFIRTGRVILYDKQTGKRSKAVNQNWVHAILIKNSLLKDFELKQCLFGLHQLLNDADKEKIIGIVESDKTAIIATALMPQFVWMSAGAKSYLNAEKLKPLANRKGILFPDSDAHAEWAAKTSELRSVCPNLRVSNYLNDLLKTEQKRQGFDIADFLIDEKLKINQFDSFVDSYNAKLEKVLSDAKLYQDFEIILDEQVSILVAEGLTEAAAEKMTMTDENYRRIIFCV